MMKIHRAKRKSLQSQLSFMLYYYVILIGDMFRLKYKRKSSGTIRVQNKSCHVIYINSFFMSVYIAEISNV